MEKLLITRIFFLNIIFQKAYRSTADTSRIDLIKSGILSSRLLTTLKKQSFENIAGKGENAGNQHLLLFPQYLLPFQNQISVFISHLFCHLKLFTILNMSKNLLYGKGISLQYKSFENTGGKCEIASNEQFLLFPQCFLPVSKTLYHFYQI